MPIHRNEPPREPPPGVWGLIWERAQALLSHTERTYGALEHVNAGGLLAAGVAAMKATGAGEEQVLRIALRIYRDSDFKLIS
jgi:hypothetical protein